MAERTARLSVNLLGGFETRLDGKEVRGFATDKTRALLAFLAVEGKRPHRRQALAGLLWPDYPERSARTSLRTALANLRQVIGDREVEPPFLLISRQSIAFNADGAVQVDVNTFSHLLSTDEDIQPTIEELEEAADLYQGRFLEGFSLADSAAFDEWALLKREQLERQMMTILDRLSARFKDVGEPDTALLYARRRVELDPWQEPAQRELMRLLAATGRRAAALDQHETCRRLLAQELGIAPEPETTRLYEAIRDGRLESEIRSAGASPDIAPVSPAFLTREAALAADRPVFVGRQKELKVLHRRFQKALEGQGGALFVVGGAGRGKTTLLEAFVAQALGRQGVLVAGGTCNAYSGVGDPYLPFRQVLGMLTGDVEALWAAGRLTRKGATLLWRAMPHTAKAILEVGPDLIGSLLAGVPLVERTAAALKEGAEWLPRLNQLVQARASSQDSANLERYTLIDQYVQVLEHVAGQIPLLIVLDDLHWADRGSTELLLHLGRRLEGRRVLVCGAYRPGELLQRPADDRHLLEDVVAELRRLQGDIVLDLAVEDPAVGRRFVDELVDVEPNRLDEAFRRQLYHNTLGHPLFTTEMLRMLKENGDLLRDSAGYWVAAASLAWDRLPAQVEAVIQKRVDRLNPEAREVLAIASVVGEEFAADVVGRVAGLPHRRLLHILSQELGRRHRLLRESSDLTAGSQSTSRFRFSHHLIQRYAYSTLGFGERRLLHGEIARAIESLFADDVETVTNQLAYHYRLAGDAEKALLYLQKAGDRARVLYALQEAVESYESALGLLRQKAEPEMAARLLMKLGLTYHHALDFEKSRQAYDEAFALWHELELTDVDERPPAPHPLRLVIFEPASLDPGREGQPAVSRLFSALIRLNPEMDVLPDVSHSWEVLDGGRKYVFHLREDVFWTDGRQVTAADFELAIKRALTPSLGSWLAELLFDIKNAQAYHRGELPDPGLLGVRAPDRLTLEVEMDRPAGYFLQLMARAYPVPGHLIDRLGEAWAEPDNFVSNGPFRLRAWVRDRQYPGIVFEANPTYHGRFGGNVQQVEAGFLREYSEKQTVDAWKERLRRFGDDSLDWVGLQGLDPTDVRRARRQYAEELVSLPLLSTAVLAFDSRQPPFSDPRVRRAFALATDRDSLANKAIDGLHFPVTGGFIPPGMPGHVPGIALRYDPDRARQLLAAAGYPGGKGLPRLSLVAPFWGEWGERKEALLDALWQEILGAQVTFHWLGYEERQAMVNGGEVHMWISGWSSDYPDPDNWLRVGARVYSPGWRNVRYDGLIEQARERLDQQERLELYRQAEGILIEEVPFLPLYYRRALGLLQPWIKNTPWDALSGQWFWQDIIIEDH